MRRYFIYFTILATILLCRDPAHAADLKDGFSGIRWGARISTLDGLSKVQTEGGVVYYANPNEAHILYNIEAPEVIYGFYLDQFFAVHISIEKIEVFLGLKKQLKSEYGMPHIKTSTKTQETIHQWKHGDIRIDLKARNEEAKSKLSFYYTPLSDRMDESQLAEIQDTSVKWFPIDRNKKPRALPVLTF